VAFTTVPALVPLCATCSEYALEAVERFGFLTVRAYRRDAYCDAFLVRGGRPVPDDRRHDIAIPCRTNYNN